MSSAAGRRRRSSSIITIISSKIHSRLSLTPMQRMGSSDPVLRFLSGHTGNLDISPDCTMNGSTITNDTTTGTGTVTGGIYLHVGPSGDFWTGHSIFAAKHLPPDYVKSVKLGDGMDVDGLLELLEEEQCDSTGTQWTRTIYDEGAFPKDLLDRLDRQPSKE